jgi:Ca2+/Na+ antiporter
MPHPAIFKYITSKETTTKVRVEGGVRSFSILVWNPTVANLTLMALGSSAPEILLACIEIVSGGFYAGDLGPGTIVGSAAFNLMVISAVCVVSIPSGESRRIKELPVFLITATFSIFACTRSACFQTTE